METDTKQFIAGEIEKLAAMVQKGFAAVDKRFENVDVRLGGIESTMATKEEVTALFDRIEGNALHRISKLEIDVADLRLETQRLRAELEA